MRQASKTADKPKRRLHRDPSTGTFESPSPLNDPYILDAAVHWVRAIDKLQPMFEARVELGDKDDPHWAPAHLLVAQMLGAYKNMFLEQLSLAEDQDFHRRAKNKPLQAIV